MATFPHGCPITACELTHCFNMRTHKQSKLFQSVTTGHQPMMDLKSVPSSRPTKAVALCQGTLGPTAYNMQIKVTQFKQPNYTDTKFHYSTQGERSLNQQSELPRACDSSASASSRPRAPAGQPHPAVRSAPIDGHEDAHKDAAIGQGHTDLGRGRGDLVGRLQWFTRFL